VKLKDDNSYRPTYDILSRLKYLNLGCGSHFHADWTNVDFTSTGEEVIAHNLREGAPFNDNVFDLVYHSHVLEHFSKDEGVHFVKECHRVLKPGGILRVVVPDLEAIARIYIQALENALAGKTEWTHHYQWILLEMYDQVVRTVSGGAMADYFRQDAIPNEDFVIRRLGLEAENLIQALRGTSPPAEGIAVQPSDREALLRDLLGDEDYTALQIGRFRQSGEVHQWMYDRYSLQVLLEQVGFKRITVCQHDESAIPHFRGFCLDTRSDGRVRKPDSLFVEARKVLVSDFPSPPLQEVKAMSQKAKPKNLDDLPQVQSLSHCVQQQQQQIIELRQQTDELTMNLGKSRKRIRRLKSELEQVNQIVNAMERSPFWKARSYWQKLRQLLKTR